MDVDDAVFVDVTGRCTAAPANQSAELATVTASGRDYSANSTAAIALLITGQYAPSMLHEYALSGIGIV